MFYSLWQNAYYNSVSPYTGIYHTMRPVVGVVLLRLFYASKMSLYGHYFVTQV